MKNNNENIEIIETSVEETPEVKSKKSFKEIFSSITKFFKGDKIKNDALLRRGGYSLAITAAVLAVLMLLNWLLMPALADRFHLEFDMTSNQKNSIAQENIDYIKGIETEVNITIIGTEEEFADVIAYYAQNYYGVVISSSSDLEYFEQTKTLISKYGEYNDKLNIKYVDPQSTEFAAITSLHSNYSFVYGDIIVDSHAGSNKRTKILSFSDIYALTEDSSSSYYGYTSYTLAANKLESALTSAIAYVTSTDTKKVAILSGHSNNSYTSAYTELLVSNNYDITEISDKLISEIPSEYDAIIISAPTTDFIGTELEAISEFLDNGGKLGKGLMFFADAASPYLPNLYDFLAQWGIQVGEGIVFETYNRNIFGDTPSTLGTFAVELEDDDITAEFLNTGAITNYNVPMNVCEPSTTYIKATALMQTLETTVVAPVGAAADWAGYTEDDMKQFDTVIQSIESRLDSDNNEISSYVMAFSSVEYVQSTWASYNLCNQDIVMAATDRAAHVGDTSITFTSKVIENESFAANVTAGSSKIVNIIFMFVIPISIVTVGIIVFVRRRNAR